MTAPAGIRPGRDLTLPVTNGLVFHVNAWDFVAQGYKFFDPIVKVRDLSASGNDFTSDWMRSAHLLLGQEFRDDFEGHIGTLNAKYLSNPPGQIQWKAEGTNPRTKDRGEQTLSTDYSRPSYAWDSEVWDSLFVENGQVRGLATPGMNLATVDTAWVNGTYEMEFYASPVRCLVGLMIRNAYTGSKDPGDVANTARYPSGFMFYAAKGPNFDRVWPYSYYRARRGLSGDDGAVVEGSGIILGAVNKLKIEHRSGPDRFKMWINDVLKIDRNVVNADAFPPYGQGWGPAIYRTADNNWDDGQSRINWIRYQPQHGAAFDHVNNEPGIWQIDDPPTQGFWLPNINQVRVDGDKTIFVCCVCDGDTQGWMVSQFEPPPNSGKGWVFGFLRVGSVGRLAFWADQNPVWTNAAAGDDRSPSGAPAIYELVLSAGVARLYRNGTLRHTSAAGYTTAAGNNHRLALGDYIDGNVLGTAVGTAADWRINWILNAAMLYNRALTDQERQDVRYKLRDLFNVQGVV